MQFGDKNMKNILPIGFRVLLAALLIHLAGCASGNKGLVVNSITPSTIPLTGGQVIINGQNFSATTTVSFGGVQATGVYWGGSTLLTATAPASQTPGAVDVIVSDSGRGSVTLSKALTYQAAPQTPVVSSTPICTGAVCTYQAENPQSTLIGGAQIDHCDGCSGGEKVGWLGGGGFVAINDIYAPATGIYTLTVYGVDGDGPGGYRNLTAAVNGASPQTVQVSGTNWNGTAPGVSTQVQLNQGSSNTIEFGNAGGYAPDLDYIVISPSTTGAAAACTLSICQYEGEDSRNTLQGGASVNVCSGCSGGYKAGNLSFGGSVTANNVYAPATGSYNLTIYGVDGDGPGNSRPLLVQVNGQSAVQVNVSGTSWNATAPGVTIPVQLNQGNNSIQFGNPYWYAPDVDYFVISPLPQIFTMGSGPIQIDYDLNSGRASFVYNGVTKIANFYSEVYLGGAAIQSTSPSYTRQVSTGANGETDVTLSATDGTPTMVQRFIINSNDYVLVQVQLQGTNLSSNSMSPIVTTDPASVDLGSYGDTRFLMVPFDNDNWASYNAASSNGLNMATAYEASAFYDNTSRNGLVIGSVTHDTWKTGITVSGSNNRLDYLAVMGGMADPEDQIPHGAITGDTISSPTIMVGYYNDWRDGMEEFANVNAQFAPKLNWTGPSIMGWSSWGEQQTTIAPNTAADELSYFHQNLTNFNNRGVTYFNLDANGGSWTDPQLAAFTKAAHANGQKAGIYWDPWAYWGTDLTQLVEGSDYSYGEIVMRDQHGNPLKQVDGAYALDPTHPGTMQRIDYYALRFTTDGFDYIKLDFLSHGILEGGSNNGAHYAPAVMTGVQAYNQGMSYVSKKFGATMFLDESIAPIFPYQYAHARRVSCDTYGGIGDPQGDKAATTSYEMNSASYGWWLAGPLYNYNDPDQMVLEGYTSNENKSRVTSAAVAGFMIDGDIVDDSGTQDLLQQWLTNGAINQLPALNLHFRPVDGNTGMGPAPVLVAHSGNTYYLAVFNYDGSNPANVNIDLGHAGLDASAKYAVTDLWTASKSTATGSLSVSLQQAESTVLELVPANY